WGFSRSASPAAKSSASTASTSSGASARSTARRNRNPRKRSLLLRQVFLACFREIRLRIALQDFVGALKPRTEGRLGQLEPERGLSIGQPLQMFRRDHLSERGPQGADILKRNAGVEVGERHRREVTREGGAEPAVGPVAPRVDRLHGQIEPVGDFFAREAG